MKILSYREYEYIKNPNSIDTDYGYVLKHRIKKKVEHMQIILDIVQQSGILLSKKERKKAIWRGMVQEAMSNLPELDEKLWNPHYEKYNKTTRKLGLSTDKDFKKLNKALWEYQREIVRLVLGNDALKKEIH